MKGQIRYVRFLLFSPVLLYSTNAFIIRQKSNIISNKLPSCSFETSLQSYLDNIGGNEGPHNTFNINGKPNGLNDPTFGDNFYYNGSSKPMNINQAHSKLSPQARQTNNSWNQNSYSAGTGTPNTGRSSYIDEFYPNTPTFGDNFAGNAPSLGIGPSFRNPSNGNVSQSPSTSTTKGNSSPWNSFNLSDRNIPPAKSLNPSYSQNNGPSYSSSVYNGVPEASQTNKNYLHPDKFSTEANSVPYDPSSRNQMPYEEPTKNNYLHPATYLNKANFGENKGYY